MQGVADATHKVITDWGVVLVIGENVFEEQPQSRPPAIERHRKFEVIATQTDKVPLGTLLRLRDGVVYHDGRPRHHWRLRAL